MADLSTFHKFLKERIAHIINLKDDVTGHCWEERFKSIVALDEEAIVAHMVYVALNPVRASMAKALDEYEFSSIAERIDELKRRIAVGEFSGEVETAREKLRSARLGRSESRWADTWPDPFGGTTPRNHDCRRLIARKGSLS